MPRQLEAPDRALQAAFDGYSLPGQLRNARMMVNYGHGDVRDEPDPLHEEAADAIERLEAENEQLRAALVAEREAIAAQARLYASYYPRGSDGRNTFTILAEWVEARNSRNLDPNPKPGNETTEKQASNADCAAHNG